MESVKIHVDHRFKSYEEALKLPICETDMMWMCVDMTTYDMPAQLHIAFRGIREYQFRNKNALPPLNDD